MSKSRKEREEIYDHLMDILNRESKERQMSVADLLGFFSEGLRSVLTSFVVRLVNPWHIKILKMEMRKVMKRAINKGIKDGRNERKKNKQNKNE